MRTLLLAALLSAAAIATASAKVHVVPKAQVCMRGDEAVTGLTVDQCKRLNAFNDGKIVKGCYLNGGYRPQLSEEECDVLDGSWDYWLKQ